MNNNKYPHLTSPIHLGMEGKTVICALGQRANRADVDALRGCAPFVREVGDCVRPANITKAIYEAYHAAAGVGVAVIVAVLTVC